MLEISSPENILTPWCLVFGVWLYGCMVLWLYEIMLFGFLFLAVWFYCFMVFWLYGVMVLGFVVVWFHAFCGFASCMALWFYGCLNFWLYGFIVSRPQKVTKLPCHVVDRY